MPDMHYPRSIVAFAVWDGVRLYLPYPGGRTTGSKAAADHVVAPNKHLGWETVECMLTPLPDGDEQDA